jgi:5-methylcytosine-specific restriction endonuclease McrA
MLKTVDATTRGRFNRSARVRIRASFDPRQYVGPVDPNEVLLRQATVICPKCGKPITDDYEFDHIVPLSQGGRHELTNLQAIHKKCHAIKTKEDLRRTKLDTMSEKAYVAVERERIRMEVEEMMKGFFSP